MIPTSQPVDGTRQSSSTLAPPPSKKARSIGLTLPTGSKREHVNVGIVGAGPVGLAAAITLHQLGHRNIVLWEKRDCSYTRPVHFNLRAEFIGKLRELGVYDSLFGPAGPINTLTFVDTATGRPVRGAGAGLPGATVPSTASCLQMLEQPSVAQVKLADLEKALL